MATTATTTPAYRTPRPVRTGLAAVAALVAVLLVVQGTISLLDLASRHTRTEVTTHDGVRALVVEDASDIHLTSGPAGSPVEVRAHVTEGLTSPERAVRLGDGGTLRLSSSCPLFFSESCDVDYDIRVPAGTAVRADTSSGDIEVENLRTTAPVRLDTSAGDVFAIGVMAPSLSISTRAGDVRASGVRADRVTASTSAGDVRLSLAGLADELEATTSAGDVELVVPDAVYRLRTETSAGTVDDQDVRTSRSAARTIRAETSAGDIRIEVRR
jgi:hypothetical protein